MTCSTPPTVQRAFPGEPASVREARRFVHDTLDALAMASDTAVLLASELATNAVVHADTSYTVTIRPLRGGVHIAVEDGSPVRPARRRYSVTSGTGRGLSLVEDVATEWGVDATATGKCVWFRLDDTALRGGRDDLIAAPAPDTDDLDAVLAHLGVDDDITPRALAA